MTGRPRRGWSWLSERHATYGGPDRKFRASVVRECGMWKARLDGEWIVGRSWTVERAMLRVERLIGRPVLADMILRTIARREAVRSRTIAALVRRGVRTVQRKLSSMVAAGQLTRSDDGRYWVKL